MTASEVSLILSDIEDHLESHESHDASHESHESHDASREVTQPSGLTVVGVVGNDEE